MTVSIRQGDALERLRELPPDHFHCVVTSPPYWGLRDYGVDGQIGLEETLEAWCALAAEELGRDCTLIELNPKSVRMAHAQIERARARRYIGDDVTREPADQRQGALL